jgi:two-component system chemotaxis response regulator CheY
MPHKNSTVLVIDDNEMIRMLLRTILTDDGYVVVGEASQGATGLELARKLQPQVIFLDIMLPDRNGISMLEELREMLPETMVLMVTGKNDADSVKTALEFGAKGYIIKPFNMATVSKTIANAIARALEN